MTSIDKPLTETTTRAMLAGWLNYTRLETAATPIISSVPIQVATPLPIVGSTDNTASLLAEISGEGLSIEETADAQIFTWGTTSLWFPQHNALSSPLSLINQNNSPKILGRQNNTIAQYDRKLTLQIQEHFEIETAEIIEREIITVNIREMLREIEAITARSHGILYAMLSENGVELALIREEAEPTFKTIEIPLKTLENIVYDAKQSVVAFNADNFLPSSQQLYDILIRPMEPELQELDGIIIAPEGILRLLPFAALHDGEQYLIEKYGTSLIPSVALFDASYRSLENAKILAMGISEFSKELLKDLPYIEEEIAAISSYFTTVSYFNSEATLNNFKNQYGRTEIAHLATHADESSLQLWDATINFEIAREILQSPLELLILSACQTGTGKTVELGFAGLGLATGARSVAGSLWQVGDRSTSRMMDRFYYHLSQGTMKNEALQLAQQEMLKANLSPAHWASFVLVGTPW